MNQYNGDIQALEDFKKSLEDERDKIDQMAGEVADLEESTADDMKIVDESTKELVDLEKQADEEENQGQISQTRDQIQSM